MTLLEIIEVALKQMGEDTESSTMDEYKDLLTRYINEAYMEIAKQKLRLVHEETITFEDLTADISDLSKDLYAILKIETADGANVPFWIIADEIKILAGEGDLIVAYYYLPDELSGDNDVPQTHLSSHMCMADYATFRGLLLGGPGSRKKSEVFLNRYLDGIARIGTDGFNITNKF